MSRLLRFILGRLSLIKSLIHYSARTMADQFAEHSGTQVGRILHADQGNFSISSTEGDYDSHKTLMQKIRVVSYLTYALEG